MLIICILVEFIVNNNGYGKELLKLNFEDLKKKDKFKKFKV